VVVYVYVVVDLDAVVDLDVVVDVVADAVVCVHMDAFRHTTPRFDVRCA